MRAKRALQSLSLSQGRLRGIAQLARVLRETKNVSLRTTKRLADFIYIVMFTMYT
jgi:hypothetical protein